jgi:putative tricarboxylic transport membrane protein
MSEGVNASPKPPGFGAWLLSPGPFRGGVIITLLAIGLFVSTFYASSPTVPRTIAILLALVGIATSAGLVPVRGPHDFYGGLMLVLIAALALVASAELPGQRGFAFGPGTAPRLFAALLAGLGVAVAVVGVLFEGPKIEKYAIRGPVLVVASILAFAAMIRPLGLVIASFLTFLLSIFGSKEMRLVESIIGAAAMTAFCVLLFTYLLNLPFQLWPRF